MNSEGYSFYEELLEHTDQPLDEDVRPRLLQGRTVRATDYLRALRRRSEMQRDMYDAFAMFDAMLTPTTMTAALALEEVDQTTGLPRNNHQNLGISPFS